MKPLFAILVTLITLSAPLFAGPLDGVWMNTDPATRSMPQVEIDGAKFIWWGKTHPENSKYGPFELTFFGDSVSDESPNKYGYIVSDSGFATRTMTIKLDGEQLVVESFTVFKDDSGRANYRNIQTFKK